MGLQGMISDLVEKSDFPLGKKVEGCSDDLSNVKNIAKLISAAENYQKKQIGVSKNQSISSKI